MADDLDGLAELLKRGRVIGEQRREMLRDLQDRLATYRIDSVIVSEPSLALEVRASGKSIIVFPNVDTRMYSWGGGLPRIHGEIDGESRPKPPHRQNLADAIKLIRLWALRAAGPGDTSGWLNPANKPR